MFNGLKRLDSAKRTHTFSFVCKLKVLGFRITQLYLF